MTQLWLVCVYTCICLEIYFCYMIPFLGPNSYQLPSMLGQTKQGGKVQLPIYSLTGRSKIGSFHEDLQKVTSQ